MSEEVEEPIEEYVPTEFELLCQRLRHSNGALYGYFIVDRAFMDTEIPEGVHWSAVPTGEITADPETGEEVPETRQKTLWEYVSYIELPDDQVMFSLCALERPTIRHRKVCVADIQDWYNYLQAYGKDVTGILDSEQRETILRERMPEMFPTEDITE
jgi:hypothetical protein